jgi:hypothetical protein
MDPQELKKNDVNVVTRDGELRVFSRHVFNAPNSIPPSDKSCPYYDIINVYPASNNKYNWVPIGPSYRRNNNKNNNNDNNSSNNNQIN